MKPLILTKPLAAVFICMVFLSSCAPLLLCRVEYLGETYPSSSKVDVYLDARQVKKEYKLMGRMTRCSTSKAEKTKKIMLDLAKKNGADGIIFLEFFFPRYEDDRNGDGVIRAELIKYL